MILRDMANRVKDFIENDEVLHDDGHVTVVVEDKAVVGYEIANAIAGLGVCVLISVVDFTRIDRSPFLQGNVEFQITCYENPELNRDDDSVLTAQGVAERLVQILHYTKFPHAIGPMIFKNFSRDDVDEANVVRGNYEMQVALKDNRENK